MIIIFRRLHVHQAWIELKILVQGPQFLALAHYIVLY